MSDELIKEFKEIFEDFGYEHFEFFTEGYSLDIDYSGLNEAQIEWLRNHNYEFVEQDGGGEGGTEHCYCIIKLDGRYFKFEYSYQSYSGYYYDDFVYSMREVKPRKVEVTVYD